MKRVTKSSILALAAVVMLVSGGQKAQASEIKPALVNQVPDIVFTPYGFDNNDNAQLVLVGNMPSTCYKVGPVRVKVDRERKVVYLNPQAYFYGGCWCAEVLVPYVQPIELGILPEGGYDVVVQKENGSFTKMGEFPIALSTNKGPDDYLYAPVREAEVRWKDATPYVVVRGTFTNTCMRLKEVKVVRRPRNVITVLPIVEMANTGCRHEKRPFEARVELNDVPQGVALIHVRSLNGQSINKVAEF